MPNLKSKIESLLFISNQPFTIRQLVNLIKEDKKKVEEAVAGLMADYQEANKGVIIQKIEDKIQMATAPDNAKLIKDFLKQETTGELSRPALETLTIIAYRGPIAKADIEQIRGVNCSIILRNLLIRGLVESKEDKKNMTTSYNITMDFLRHLGLSQQSELPDYEKLNSSDSINKVLNPEEVPDPVKEEPLEKNSDKKDNQK